MNQRYELIDPIGIYFTHSRIRPFFSGCGRRVKDTIMDIETGKLDISNLPMITILQNGEFYFSLNNRRLYVLKELRKKGILDKNQIKVRIKQANMQECNRYVASKCSLQASIMKEYDKNKIDNDNDDNNNDNNNDNNDNNNDDNNNKLDNYNDNNEHTNEKDNKKVKIKTNESSSTSIDPTITKSLKSLMKLVDKGKYQQVEQQLNTWILSKMINETQKLYIMEEIGMN